MSGVITIDTRHWQRIPDRLIKALPWKFVTAFVVGALLSVALSVPSVLVPGTRTGAIIAAALIAGALVARGRAFGSRVAVASATGLVLSFAITTGAWLILSDESNSAPWQVVALEVVTHSMIKPLDDAITPWLGETEQFGEHLLLVRFTISNLVLGIAGGLLGGLLASGRPHTASDISDSDREGTDEGSPDRIEGWHAEPIDTLANNN